MLTDLEGLVRGGDTIAAVERLRDVRAFLESAVRWPDVPQIDLLALRVSVPGKNPRLSPTEQAVLMRLALSGGYCSAGDLGDLLFSHLTPSSALQSLKVVVHRLRRKLEWPGILRVSSGGYGLHSSVKCDLVSAESEIRRALMEQKPLANERRERCVAFLQRLRESNGEAFLRWDWFCELDRRRNRLRRDVALALACDARASGHTEDALLYASELSRWDPIDEAAREIAIRAYIDCGDHALAKREYDDYAGALRVELDAEPSDDVRALIACIGTA